MTTQALGARKKLSDESGRKRAAALLIALGPDVASEVLKSLPEDDISRRKKKKAITSTITGSPIRA